MKEVKHLYRYIREWLWDEENYEQYPNISLKKYEVIRETPKCWVIKKHIGSRKETFILKDPYTYWNGELENRFAYENKDNAFQSFKFRTERSLTNALNNVDSSKQFLELIKEQENKQQK